MIVEEDKFVEASKHLGNKEQLFQTTLKDDVEQ